MLGIREKVAATLALLLLLSAAIGGLAIARFDALGRIAQEITGNWLPSIQVIGRAAVIAQRHRALVALHILNTDPARMTEVERDLTRELTALDAARRDYAQMISSAEERQIEASFGAAWSAYLRLVERTLDLSRRNENVAATAIFQGELWQAFTTAREALDRLVAVHVDGGAAATRQAEAVRETGMALILGALGLGAVIGAGSLAWIVRGIGRDLDGLARPMQRLAEGDVEAPIPALPARTEMGRMAALLGTLAASLRDAAAERAAQQAAAARAEAARKAGLLGLGDSLERQVGDVVDGIAAAATELSGAATAMVAIADGASRRAATVSTAGATANGDVNAVAAATEELAASVGEISRQVAESARMATAAVEQSGRTDATVANLTDAAQKIGEVTRLIGDIAAQTNLLALNATIEAARAGEAGKGFAVVASEVKTLASQTAKATESISGQIAAMQAATQEAAGDLGAIRTSIGRINDVTAAIAAAVEEQGAATRDIARSVQRAASGTQAIAAEIAGVSAAAGETGGAAAQVQATAQTLSGQAETLRRQVSGFLSQVRAA